MSQMEMTVTITGAKRFKDSIEGQPYDFTTVFCQLGLDTSTGNAVGQAGAEYKWGTSENYLKIAPLLEKGNFRAAMTLDQVTTGKVLKTIVTDVRPITQPVAQKV